MGIDTVVGEKARRVSRVFGGDDIYFSQHAQRPQRDIFQIADGCGHDMEHCIRHIIPESIEPAYYGSNPACMGYHFDPVINPGAQS